MNCQYKNPSIQTGRVFLYGYSILSTAIYAKPTVAIPILSTEKLSSKYQSFILEYIFQVLVTERNWSNITAVALALIDEETFTYDRGCEVIMQNINNQVLK